jgi:hypothetical protein
MAALIDLMWPESSPATGVSPPHWDPLVHDDGLREAELLDVRIDPGRSTVGLIFGLGGALQLDTSDTGVLVARRVQQAAWSVMGPDPSHAGGRYARYVMSSAWSSTADGACLSLGMQLDVELSITALDFDFYEVDLAGGAYVVPDYTELDDAAIHAQQPNWNSPYRLRTWTNRTSRNASPSGPTPGHRP